MYLLIIENNLDQVAQVYDFFEARGHVVDVAYDGASGIEFSGRNAYDVIMLNKRLPDMTGFELCSCLRESGQVMPILMVARSRLLQHKLDGFASGIDDYVGMPFDLLELDARMHALMRRANQDYIHKSLQVGDLEFDPLTMQVNRAGQVLALPPIPLRILAYLVQHSPAIVSRREIERHIWGNDRPETDALRAHLYILRNVIDKPFKQKLLRTVRGIGYQLMESA